jgi:transketolase
MIAFGESATPDQLMTKYKLDPSDIVAAVQKVMKSVLCGKV